MVGIVLVYFKGNALRLLQHLASMDASRLRVDQLMYMSWKVLTPFAFACVLALRFGVGVVKESIEER